MRLKHQNHIQYMNSNNDRKSYLPITMFFPLNASRVFMNSAVSRHVSGASGK